MHESDYFGLTMALAAAWREAFKASEVAKEQDDKIFFDAITSKINALESDLVKYKKGELK